MGYRRWISIKGADGKNDIRFMFFLTLLNHVYWVTGAVFGTVLNRAISLILFPSVKNPPSYTDISDPDQFLPAALSICFIIVLHNWKENTLLSIGLSTAFYMFLLQMVFSY